MHILLTRPEVNAKVTAATLVTLGHTVEIAPMLNIVTLPQQILDRPFGAVVFTSQNTVSALAKIAPTWFSSFKGRVFAVGTKTAKSLEEQGFDNVYVGGGGVAGFAEYIANTLGENGQGVYLPRGRHVSGDLEGDLIKRGFKVESQIIYKASPAQEIPSNIVGALKNDKFDRVLFYSSRTAITFVELARDAGISGMKAVVAVALSPAIGKDLGALSWAEIRIAPKKNEESLIRTL